MRQSTGLTPSSASNSPSHPPASLLSDVLHLPVVAWWLTFLWGYVCVCVCVVWPLSYVLLFCYPMDCSPARCSARGIFQAKILDWVAISFSRGSSQPRGQTQVFCTAGWFFLMFEPPGKPISFNMTSILCMEYFFPSHLTIVHSEGNNLKCQFFSETFCNLELG